MAADRFTQISNDLFRDPRLSFKAKGVFGLISTHRDGYGVTAVKIAEQGKEGLDAVNSALQELESHGYLERERERKPNGQLGGIEYFITDMPRSVPVDEHLPPASTCNDAKNPRSEPVRENPEQALTCEDAQNRRSEPKRGYPMLAEPVLANPVTKNTKGKKTKEAEHSVRPSVRPSATENDLEQPANKQTDGRTDGVRDEDTHLEQARQIVAELDLTHVAPNRGQHTKLVTLIGRTLADGLDLTSVQAHAKQAAATAKTMKFVLGAWEPDKLPAPVNQPQRANHVDAVQPSPRWAECDECGRPVALDSPTSLCPSCRSNAEAVPETPNEMIEGARHVRAAFAARRRKDVGQQATDTGTIT